MTQQVTDRIEKKLQELDNLEHTRSITTAGQTIVFVDLLPETNARDVKPTWSRVRNLIDDIKHEFPQGVVGPFFDDQFGDVYGNIFAFTGDGLSQRELRDFAEDARTQILKMPDVGKVDIVGAQDEVIYLEFSTRKIAALGIDRAAIIATLQAQNAVTQSGFVEAGPERVALRVGGRFHLRRHLARDQSEGKRPLLSADGRRHHHPRLCRSADARSSASTESRQSGSRLA